VKAALPQKRSPPDESHGLQSEKDDDDAGDDINEPSLVNEEEHVESLENVEEKNKDPC
jgi:hypothetical protein